MITYHILASGSNGNCTLVQTPDTNILIDVGISLRSVKEKLKTLNLTLEEIDAVLITHEHIDHTRSLKQIPLEKIYSGAGTCSLIAENELQPYTPFSLQDMTIIPIPLSHDCVNGFGYLIHNHVESLVYLTDTGYVAQKNKEYLKNATHYIVECNHDVAMLSQSNRPAYLIRRILSDSGHLNNEQCGEFLASVISHTTKSITLAHLSGEANDPKLALSTVQTILKEYNIDYQHIQIKSASRHCMIKGWDDEKSF